MTVVGVHLVEESFEEVFLRWIVGVVGGGAFVTTLGDDFRQESLLASAEMRGASVEVGEVDPLEGRDDVSGVRRAEQEVDLVCNFYEVLEFLLLGFVHPAPPDESFAADWSCEDVDRQGVQAGLDVDDLAAWDGAYHPCHIFSSYVF